MGVCEKPYATGASNGSSAPRMTETEQMSQNSHTDRCHGGTNATKTRPHKAAPCHTGSVCHKGDGSSSCSRGCYLDNYCCHRPACIRPPNGRHTDSCYGSSSCSRGCHIDSYCCHRPACIRPPYGRHTDSCCCSKVNNGPKDLAARSRPATKA